jgi:ubiquinone/menaquinone biosynthesis C-methylase UbiE
MKAGKRMSSEAVIDFYTRDIAHEWKRLAIDSYHRLEFVTTMHFLLKYLPEQGLILDAGGGPGRYTIELAQLGYEMVLFDLTPANLAFAQAKIKRAKVQRQVREIVQGSLVDLSHFPDNYFDAVLCLGGPLSHVLSLQERKQATSELVRVAKPGAPLFASVIGRLATLVSELTLFPHEIELPLFLRLRDSGDYDGTSGFTACHFFLPEDLEALFQGLPVEKLEIAGLEGLSSNHRRLLNKLARHPARWKIWLETHFQTCTHPAVVGMSPHILFIGRKTQ